MIFEQLETLRLYIADFLNIIIINKYYLFVNLWSVVHFLSGVLLMFIFFKFKKLREIHKFFRYFIIFLLLVSWELFELYFYSKGIFFKIEGFRDIYWDIKIAMIGAILYDIFI